VRLEVKIAHALAQQLWPYGWGILQYEKCNIGIVTIAWN